MKVNEIVHQDSIVMGDRARELQEKILRDRREANHQFRKTLLQAGACVLATVYVLRRLIKQK